MASLFPDLENDIFISYRQNDNKYDGWVAEFVFNLNKELEATIKEKITVYFDGNAHDGLLETHNVDKSLSNKLRSLIFIPVLSQTYCDTGSYAWQHEFLAFNKMALEDRFGRDIILRNGNVISRILPIRIHDLDIKDLNMVQEAVGGPLRSIDFFFRETGVNRPLRPDDQEEKNFKKTSYRNQVNKLANSIKEILFSLQEQTEVGFTENTSVNLRPGSKGKSVAVLPFVNMSNDPEQEYFTDGISEEIINTLVQLPGLKVAGRTSSFSFKNKNEDLRSIAEKLNVNTILEGSVRKSGNRIRVTVQLIEASTGFHLWSQKFDRELNDIFIIQDEIAKTIVDKLQVTLNGQPEPKERAHSQNIEAYRLYLKGMSLFYKRGLHMFEGLQCFKDALKIDPDYALALSGLADSYTMLCLHSYMPPEEAWQKAAEAANRALRLNTELAEVHSTIATIAMLFERDWLKAEKEYKIALQLGPNYLQGRSWYAVFYLQIFKQDYVEGLRQSRLAAEYDPLSAYVQTITGGLASQAGFHDEAITAGKRSVELDNESFSAWYFLGYSYHCAGDLSSAIHAYKQAIGISGRHNWALLSLLALLNEPSEYQQEAEADFIYRELLSKEKVGYVSPFLLAVSSAALDKNEEALQYLKAGLERHDPFIAVLVPGRPDNKKLLAIPEFSKIMKTIGLR